MAIKIKRRSTSVDNNISSERSPAEQKNNIGLLTMKRMAMKDIHPSDYNPRLMSSDARKGLSHSIDRFGLMEPIVINIRTGNMIGGHQRYYDLLRKKQTHTDVVIKDMPLEKEKEANIALNNPNIQGVFTEDLQGLLKEMDAPIKEDLMFTNLETEDAVDNIIDDTGKIKDKAKKRKMHRATCPKCEAASKMVCTECGMEW